MALLQVISKIENVEGLKPSTQTRSLRQLRTSQRATFLWASEELRGVVTRAWRGRQSDSE